MVEPTAKVEAGKARLPPSEWAVLFRGHVPMRLENFQFLESIGMRLEPREADPYLWAASGRHPQWGEVDLQCPRVLPVQPQHALGRAADSGLTQPEKDAIIGCGSCVLGVVHPAHDDVFRDRKLALRAMRAVMGDYGVAVIDDGSGRVWSRSALDEELAHDAALDIDSLLGFHLVSGEGADRTPVWLHSHGLAELGFFDFDILEPSSDVIDRWCNLPRAIALGIVEGWIEADSSKVEIARPEGGIRMVPADVFQRRAPACYAAMRDDPDGYHSTNRSVVCNPVERSWSTLFGYRVEPCRWLRRPLPENLVAFLSMEATRRMARRARDSYPLCRRYLEELAELEVKARVKLGLPVDGDADQREHLWFDATKLEEGAITGILMNEPWAIASLVKGQSYVFSPEVLSDWYIATPHGRITPIDGTVARMLRANREELRGRDIVGPSASG